MNARFLPPDIPPPKSGGGGGSLSSKKVRSQNSTNPIPSSKDFSLLTALVGAMIINESKQNLHLQQESDFSTFLQGLFSKSVSTNSSTQAIISVAALESLAQVQERLESISHSRVISFADVENLVINFADELFPHLTIHIPAYQVANQSLKALHVKYFDRSMIGDTLSEKSDRTDRSMGLEQIAGELAEHNSKWWHQSTEIVNLRLKLIWTFLTFSLPKNFLLIVLIN
jgi:hypothetical protein